MKANLRQITEVIWELPTSFAPSMQLPVRFIATEKLVEAFDEAVFAQAANVASLPGLVEAVYVMPDSHSGYGAPIGCVFAADQKEGIVSPGAIGFDINCGMRLITTGLTIQDVQPRIRDLVNGLFEHIPVGVGGRGFLPIKKSELSEVMIKGAQWVIAKGFGWPEDKEHIEEQGAIADANPDKVSEHAIERGFRQLATLGSGNHYLEIQRVAEVFDPSLARTLGIMGKDQVVVMIHSGSRGFGHQIATDYLRIFESKMPKYGINVPDRQLACAPVESVDGKNYLAAMAAASNFAFANRQALMHQMRVVFAKVLGKSAEELGMHLVYDVAHNIAKFEEHQGNRGSRKLLIHRKGATRSFPNQPVIIGGSMETGSYLLLGTEKALEVCFGSTAHGSGRTMSRHQAKREVRGDELQRELAGRGIYIRSASFAGLAEEAGKAYKDIEEVVKSVFLAGISTPVASFVPIGNIKG